jgi:hypothetical protein
MARDLIPPPSPAGRPSPDAMRNLGAPEPAAEAPGATDAHSAAPPGPTPYRSRFGFVAGALAGVAVAAAVAAVALLGSDPANRGAGSLQLADNWSTYKPSGEDVPGAIATHVQGEYELAKGK